MADLTVAAQLAQGARGDVQAGGGLGLGKEVGDHWLGPSYWLAGRFQRTSRCGQLPCVCSGIEPG